jgi:hypothetical protein
LQTLPLVADFAETRAENYGVRHSCSAAFLHDVHHPIRADRDDGNIDVALRCAQSRICALTEHVAVLRVDGHDPAAVSAAEQVRDNLAADTFCVLRCPNDGDRSRREQPLQPWRDSSVTLARVACTIEHYLLLAATALVCIGVASVSARHDAP